MIRDVPCRTLDLPARARNLASKGTLKGMAHVVRMQGGVGVWGWWQAEQVGSWLWSRGINQMHCTPASTCGHSRHHQSIAAHFAAEPRQELPILNTVQGRHCQAEQVSVTNPPANRTLPAPPCHPTPYMGYRPPFPIHFNSSHCPQGSGLPAIWPLPISSLTTVSLLCPKPSSGSTCSSLNDAPQPRKPFFHSIYAVNSYLSFKTRLQGCLLGKPSLTLPGPALGHPSASCPRPSLPGTLSCICLFMTLFCTVCFWRVGQGLFSGCPWSPVLAWHGWGRGQCWVHG